jgi:hypothetical protein
VKLPVHHQGAVGALAITLSSKNEGLSVLVDGHLTLKKHGLITAQDCNNAKCSELAHESRSQTLSVGKRSLSIHFALPIAMAVRVRVRSGSFLRQTVLIVKSVKAATPAPAAKPTVFSITTNPGLNPAYNPSLQDYTLTCASGSVNIQAGVPAGETLAINGGAAASGLINQTLPLQADEAFTFTLTANGVSTTSDVRCTPANFPTWSVQRTGTPQTQWIAMTPPGGGSLIGSGLYAVIANNWGVPVWWMSAGGATVLNASVLPSGQVAYWSPNGYGDGQIGSYRIVNLDGTSPLASGQPDEVVASTADGLGEQGANLHDFEQLSNGNYLLIATVPRYHVDLTPIGINNTNATVIDADIQEITPTGQLVWSWDSANHIALSETDAGFASTVTTWDGQPAYDIIHMNSIQLLESGNCLAASSCNIVFSARHLDAVYEINMASGNIIWKLGGTNIPGESLSFVGDPDNNFSGQHFARILPNGTLTVHDNGSLLSRPPRSVNYSINPTNMTATFLSQVTDPRVGYSNCCGSSSLLPGGNNIVTELTPAGTPVLTLTFPTGATYRAYPVTDSNLINRNTLIAGMNAQFAASQ